MVEKEASVGGKMILLSKVFPTLDCASCISTPKMGATIHHPNLTVLTYSEVEGIRARRNGGFKAKIRQKPRFVDEAACTGCRQCEMVCNVAVPDEFNADMVSRRAAYIAFPQAVPKKAVIERAGTSPCTCTCPAGIKAHGYVALIRSGEYEKAFQLVADATPLVGSLGRACYAPCEEECTRGEPGGPALHPAHQALHRRHALRQGPTVALEIPAPNGKKVAIVGSGPAGLTAAWHLARKGYEVTILEAASQPGGMLRLALPPYRLPNEVVDEDVANVTDAGRQDRHRHPGRGPGGPQEPRATTPSWWPSAPTWPPSCACPARTCAASCAPPSSCKAAKLGEPLEVEGKRVVVIGGGNVAIDAARTALRLGAASVAGAQPGVATARCPPIRRRSRRPRPRASTFRNSCGVARVRGRGRGRGRSSSCAACPCSTRQGASARSTPTAPRAASTATW